MQANQKEHLFYKFLENKFPDFSKVKSGYVQIFKRDSKKPVIVWGERIGDDSNRQSIKYVFKPYDPTVIEEISRSVRNAKIPFDGGKEVLLSIDDKESRVFRTMIIDRKTQAVLLPGRTIKYNLNGKPVRFYNENEDSITNFIQRVFNNKIPEKNFVCD